MGLIPRLGAPKHAGQGHRAPQGVPGSVETRAPHVSTDQQALKSVWASGSQAYESLGVTVVILGVLGGLWGFFLDSGHQNMQTKATEHRKGYVGAPERELALFLASPHRVPPPGLE